MKEDYKFLRSLDIRFFQPYEKGVTVTKAEEYTDGEYIYQYLELSDSSEKVEKYVL